MSKIQENDSDIESKRKRKSTISEESTDQKGVTPGIEPGTAPLKANTLPPGQKQVTQQV